MDLMNPSTYLQGYPEAFFDAREDRAPFLHESPYLNDSFWIVTSQKDVDEVYRDPQRYSSADKTILMYPPEGEELERQRKMLVNMDPPDHSNIRRKVQVAFGPKSISQLIAAAEKTAEQAFLEALNRPDCDWVTEVAEAVPYTVMAALLGIEDEETAFMKSNMSKIVLAGEPYYSASPEEIGAAGGGLMASAFRQYLEKGENDKGVLSSLLFVDGECILTMEEYCYFFVQIVAAGAISTTCALSLFAWMLGRNPIQYQWLRKNPGAINSAVEEMLRFEPPVYQILRTAVEDTNLNGADIRAGDRIAIMQHVVNRDPELNDRPKTLDLSRASPKHRTFGIGIHTCIGAGLVRLELRKVMELLVKHVAELEVDAPEERMKCHLVNGFSTLPARLVAK